MWYGRPTSIKSVDLKGCNTTWLSGPDTLLSFDIANEWEALSHVYSLDLLEYSEKITQRAHTITSEELYLEAAGLRKELRNWYLRLPQTLRWAPEVIQTAGPKYFFLQ
jgi:hypothetical protein